MSCRTDKDAHIDSRWSRAFSALQRLLSPVELVVRLICSIDRRFDGDIINRLLALQDASGTASPAIKNQGELPAGDTFSPMTSAVGENRPVKEQDLILALENGDFELYYQPQIDLASGRMVGVEALVRWTHNKLGNISPAEFIPILERIGLIEKLGVWVLNNACHQALAWVESGLIDLKVAVNISGSHFQSGRIVESVRHILELTGLDPELLELEVTETALQTEDATLATFHQLKEIGVMLAIDDFGTGFSCLNSIRRAPLDCLKVDRMFVRDLIHDPENASIVATIIAMGRAMGLIVVAEGAENVEQIQYLSSLGCAQVQGYYFSPPVPADEIPALAGMSFFPSTVASGLHEATLAAGAS